MAEERIQKILARAGYGARRKCEALIAEGRVTVNGRMANTLGDKADPERDEIAVDGLPARLGAACYIMFNKPAGCLTTAGPDPRGRAIVMDYFKDFPVRVFPVGRLDYDTEGLLLLTNDGDFGNKVLHPSRKVFKTYEAVVAGTPGEAALARLREGIELDDGPAAPARVRLLGRRRETPSSPRGARNKKPETISASVLEISIREGRKRQVRRMCRAIGHEVMLLKRMRIGALELGDLPLGKYRELTREQAELALMEIES